MRTLTVKECESLQRRKKNAFGDRWPYKGYYGEAATQELPDLPDGWLWIHIPTWGLHVRKEGDTDYMQDL